MVDYKEIYRTKAKEYEMLITREDYNNNILPAINSIIDMKDLDIVELGAGTGRLTTMLAPVVKSIKIYDESAHMLEIARQKLEIFNLNNWFIGVADNRDIPLEVGVADIVISGWSISSIVIWNEDNWQVEIDKCLKEIKRVLKKNGTIIFIETLGTGAETPTPPNKLLEDFYEYLENEYNFKSKWIRTDYKFNSSEEAEDLCRFFFGNVLADNIKENNTNIVPECTGIWWL